MCTIKFYSLTAVIKFKVTVTITIMTMIWNARLRQSNFLRYPWIEFTASVYLLPHNVFPGGTIKRECFGSKSITVAWNKTISRRILARWEFKRRPSYVLCEIISLRIVVRVWRNFRSRCLSKLDGQQRGLSKVGFNPDLKM